MSVSQVDAVYDVVTSGFVQLGASDPKCISRSFLLRELCYAGQVWRCEGWKAVWWLGSDTVEFFDATGNPVSTLAIAAETTRRAA